MIHIVWALIVGHKEAMRLLATHKWYVLKIAPGQWGANPLKIFN